MASKAIKLLSLLALLTTAAIAGPYSEEQVNNFCTFPIYITYANGSDVTSGPIEVPPNQAQQSFIVGEGEVTTVSLNPDIYSPDTAKMDLGASVSNGILYWSIYPLDGDPMSGHDWNVTSSGGPPGSAPGACGNTSTYDGQVYACPDPDGDVLLTLNLC